MHPDVARPHAHAHQLRAPVYDAHVHVTARLSSGSLGGLRPLPLRRPRCLRPRFRHWLIEFGFGWRSYGGEALHVFLGTLSEVVVLIVAGAKKQRAPPPPDRAVRARAPRLISASRGGGSHCSGTDGSGERTPGPLRGGGPRRSYF